MREVPDRVPRPNQPCGSFLDGRPIQNPTGRVGGLFGGRYHPGFMDVVLTEIEAANIEWNAFFAEGDFCGPCLRDNAMKLIDWHVHQPDDKPFVMVCSDSPATLAAVKAREERGMSDAFDIVCGVIGIGEDLAKEVLKIGSPPHDPPRLFGVQGDPGGGTGSPSAMRRLELLLCLQDPQLLSGDYARVTPGGPEENVIVLLSNYSTPLWEREVRQTFLAAEQWNATTNTAKIRLLDRGVSCDCDCQGQAHGEPPALGAFDPESGRPVQAGHHLRENTLYDIDRVLRNIDSITNLKALITVGDSAAFLYRDAITKYIAARSRPITTVWESLGPFNDWGALCWGPVRRESGLEAAKIAIHLIDPTAPAPAAVAPEAEFRLYVNPAVAPGLKERAAADRKLCDEPVHFHPPVPGQP